MSNVIPFPRPYRSRLVGEGTTPAEDLEHALSKAWDRQAAKMFCQADQRPYLPTDKEPA